MIREDASLLAGFRRTPFPRFPGRMPGTEAQMINKVLMGCRFESWVEFEAMVSETAKERSAMLGQQGCRPRNHHDDRCCGEFRNRYCHSWGCRKVTEYKREVTNDDYEYDCYADDIQLSCRTSQLLFGLQDMAKKLRPNWSGRCSSPEPTITQVGYPYMAVLQRGLRYPDTVIEGKVPNTSELLQQLGPHHTTLAAAYNSCCAEVTIDAELSYEQRGIGRTVRHALFTRSGYGCLFNDIEAMFVKVTPRIRETRGRIVLAHSVQVSREFKCDEELSVLHGLLTMMVKGFEDSNERTAKELHGYFPILEATEVSNSGELVVRRSLRVIGNRAIHDEHDGHSPGGALENSGGEISCQRESPRRLGASDTFQNETKRESDDCNSAEGKMTGAIFTLR